MPINTLDPDESQLLLGHYIGRVEMGFWSSPYTESQGKADFDGSDAIKLYWNVAVLDVLQEDYDGVVPETVTRSWGIGKGWWADESGRYVRHNDDASDEEIEKGTAKPHVFRIVSGLGMFLGILKGRLDGYETDYGAATVLDGGGIVEYDLVGAREYLIRNKLTDSRDAQIWNGMVFEFRGLGLQYDGKRRPNMSSLPVRYLGIGDDESDAAGQMTASAQTTTANPATDAATWVESGAPANTAAILVKLAGSSPSHSEFARNALLLPDVEEGSDLEKAVLDEANWSS